MYLELVVLVLGALVEGSVVAELANVVDAVKALDAIGDAVHLQHVYVVRDGSHCIDLQIWKLCSQRKLYPCVRKDK